MSQVGGFRGELPSRGGRDLCCLRKLAGPDSLGALLRAGRGCLWGVRAERWAWVWGHCMWRGLLPSVG